MTRWGSIPFSKNSLKNEFALAAVRESCACLSNLGIKNVDFFIQSSRPCKLLSRKSTIDSWQIQSPPKERKASYLGALARC